MSPDGLTIRGMGRVVDLAQWRRTRRRQAGPGEPATFTVERGDPDGLDRVDRAVQRLGPLVNRALDAAGRVEPRVETELLAMIGELTVGLTREAASRAERLARRLEEVR